MLLKRELQKYLLFVFFHSLYCVVPILVLFFQSYNLTYQQIMSLLGARFILGLLLEVPSGLLSDWWGRKYSLILSALCKVLGCLVYVSSTHYEGFLIGSLFMGAASAFESGADSAYLFDLLKKYQQEEDYRQWEGKAFAVKLLSFGLAGVLGSYMGAKNFHLAFYASIIFFIVAFIMGGLLRESKPKLESRLTWKAYQENLSEAFLIVKNKPSLLMLIIYFGLMVALMISSHWYFQPYLKSVGLKIESFGTYYFVWLLMSASASIKSYQIEKKLGQSTCLIIIPVLLSIHFLALGLFSNYFALSTIFLGEFCFGLIRPLSHNCINLQVDSKQRATILSFMGLIQKLGMVIVAPLSGYLADLGSFANAFCFMGLISFILGPLLVIWFFKFKARDLSLELAAEL